jgi:hypothetical protein
MIKLKECIRELLDGAIAQGRDPSSGLLRNYIDDETWFVEASGAALIAAVVYRMAVLLPGEFGFDSRYLIWADELKRAAENCIGQSGSESFKTSEQDIFREWEP